MSSSMGATFLSDTPQSPLIGKILAGQYRLEKPLSKGGMGQVFLAKHVRLKTPRAVKIIHPELASDPEIQGRFYQEVEVTHEISMQNPHVVHVHDVYGFEDGIGFYVMEYLQGNLLTHRLKANSGTLPLHWVIRITREVCDAMQTAHDMGVIHRDLKPDNIFLIDYRGQVDFVKVVDFGIAKVQNSDAQRTEYGQIAGTLFYMSPEQIVGPVSEAHKRGEDYLDGRSDIYALGCILFEMLTGRPPFYAESPLSPIERSQIFMDHIQTPAPFVQDFRTDVPLELAEVTAKALAKAPDDRFQSMDEFAEALHAISPYIDKTVAVPTPLPPSHPLPPRPHSTAPYQNVDQPSSTSPQHKARNEALATGSLQRQVHLQTHNTTANTEPTSANKRLPFWAWIALGVFLPIAGVFGYSLLPKNESTASTEPIPSNRKDGGSQEPKERIKQPDLSSRVVVEKNASDESGEEKQKPIPREPQRRSVRRKSKKASRNYRQKRAKQRKRKRQRQLAEKRQHRARRQRKAKAKAKAQRKAKAWAKRKHSQLMAKARRKHTITLLGLDGRVTCLQGCTASRNRLSFSRSVSRIRFKITKPIGDTTYQPCTITVSSPHHIRVIQLRRLSELGGRNNYCLISKR